VGTAQFYNEQYSHFAFGHEMAGVLAADQRKDERASWFKPNENKANYYYY